MEKLNAQIACIRATADIGVDLVILHAISGIECSEPTELGIGQFGKIIRVAKEAGGRLALENTDGEAFLAALMQVYGDDPTVGFCIDTGHELCYNHAQDMIGKYGKKKVFETHLNDNMGITGRTIAWQDDAHMILFDGVADWNGIAERLKKADFREDLTFELLQSNHPGRHTNDRYVNLSQLEFFTLAHNHAVRFAEMMR